jgi:hypothetical protein
VRRGATSQNTIHGAWRMPSRVRSPTDTYAERAAPPNKAMKLTSAERIGRSQLIAGVGRTEGRSMESP